MGALGILTEEKPTLFGLGALCIIQNFLFHSGHNQAKITLGVRATLQAFSPLSRWILSRDDDDESDDFVFPPLASELGEGDSGYALSRYTTRYTTPHPIWWHTTPHHTHTPCLH